MNPTSLDYANLIAWIALTKHGVRLGKTQLQKLLYIFYGLALARFNDVPFNDDTPKAFPFGPVFPRSYKRYDGTVRSLTQTDKDLFMQKVDLLRLATWVTDNFGMLSATTLSEWSHRDEAPWKKAVYRDNTPAWGREITREDILDYFRRTDWNVGL